MLNSNTKFTDVAIHEWLLKNDPIFKNRKIRDYKAHAIFYARREEKSCGIFSIDDESQNEKIQILNETLAARGFREPKFWETQVLDERYEQICDILRLEGTKGLAQKLGRTQRWVQLQLKKIEEAQDGMKEGMAWLEKVANMLNNSESFFSPATYLLHRRFCQVVGEIEMSKTLVVVESPKKAKIIGEMLGNDYIVQASGGHIRDLPVRPGDFGYDKDTLKPSYEITERGIQSVKYLKAKFSMCGTVLLATDPDREGEAIGWHVAEVLGINNRQRVKFHEITPAAIAAAIGAPTPLDTRLVHAQEARRVVDRMVGWLVSGPLSKAINEKASAGRVQSPSLALVVEREREIKSFSKTLSFGAKLKFANWVAEWQPKEKCTSREEAEKAANSRAVNVAEYIERDEFEVPPAPFDTALLQQAASVALKFDPEQTMRIAQKLFESGLITYHRTDETNISEDAFLMIAEYAANHALPVISNRRKFKVAAGAQEAHEAIRPSHFDADTSILPADELALYTLILRRAVASQLSDVVYGVRRVKLESNGLNFIAVGKVMKDKGWRSFGVESELEDEEAVANNPVPQLEVGSSLVATDSKVVETWTRAPVRYTKAATQSWRFTTSIPQGIRGASPL